MPVRGPAEERTRLRSRPLLGAVLGGLLAMLLVALLIPTVHPIHFGKGARELDISAGRVDDEWGLGPGLHSVSFESTEGGVRTEGRTVRLRIGSWAIR